MQKNIIKIIIILLMIIGVLGGIKLYLNHGYTIIGKSQEGTELFSEDYWDDITCIAFLDVDETRYENRNIQDIQKIKDMMLSITYTEIENPWLEGGHLYEIITNKYTVEFVLVGDVIIFDGRTYMISGKTLDEQIKEIIMNDGK